MTNLSRTFLLYFPMCYLFLSVKLCCLPSIPDMDTGIPLCKKRPICNHTCCLSVFFVHVVFRAKYGCSCHNVRFKILSCKKVLAFNTEKIVHIHDWLIITKRSTFGLLYNGCCNCLKLIRSSLFLKLAHRARKIFFLFSLITKKGQSLSAWQKRKFV